MEALTLGLETNTERSEKLVGVHFMDNLQSAEQFYAEIMGFTLTQKSNRNLVFNRGNLDLYIVKRTQSDLEKNRLKSHLSESMRYLGELGCEIISQNHDSFYVRDPNGVLLDMVRYDLLSPTTRN